MMSSCVLVTGANRGLGQQIVSRLVDSSSEIHVTARQLNSLQFYKEPPYEKANIQLHQLDLDDNRNNNINHFINSLPTFTHIFHTASIYNKIDLKAATLDDLDKMYNCQRNETMLLKLLVQEKLQKNGTLIAAGAIVSIPTDSENMKSQHPWYAGLFSMHKTHLRSLMLALQQEYANHRFIHANLGTFCDENDKDNEYLKNNQALTTQEVVNQLINIALSDEKHFNVDIMCQAEMKILNQIKKTESEKKTFSIVSTPFNLYPKANTILNSNLDSTCSVVTESTKLKNN